MARGRKNAKTLFFINLIIAGLMLTSQIKADDIADVELDPTLVGVKDGDVFEFKYETFKIEINGVPQTTGYSKGDTISIHVDNATVIIREDKSCWIWFDIKINGELDERELDNMQIRPEGISYIIMPDWEAQKTYLDSVKDYFIAMENIMLDRNLTYESSLEIFDKSETFISILSYKGPSWDDPGYYDSYEERVYDKHTGVLLYIYRIAEIQHRYYENLTTYETINYEAELKRVGYSLDSELTKAANNDNSNLDYPFITLTTLMLMYYVNRKKKLDTR